MAMKAKASKKSAAKKVRTKEKKSTKFYFSPSEVHHREAAQMKPSMAYHGEDAKRWQLKLRNKLKQLLGRMPDSKVPLNIRTLWSKQHPLGQIDKIVFTSEPCCDVPAYVCIPNRGKKPYPVMICLQGHSSGMHNSIRVQQDNEDLPLEVDGDRDFAIGCMERGIAALCIEQRSFGERKEGIQKLVAAHGCHDATMQALLLGRTLAGERIYDVDRGIDYLLTRNDIDPKKIGIMGNSGGGTIALYAGAILPRIAFVMPSCSFSTFKDSLMAVYHCADNYIPGLLEVADMGDVAALIAPRPLVVVTGTTDIIFPVIPARKTFRQTKRVYEALGAGDQCFHAVCKGGHRFYAKQAWAKMLPLIQKL